MLSALKNGDEKAFKLIYNEHVSGLSSFINSYTKNQAQTDDIVQDTFLKLWASKEKLHAENSVKSFLYKVAYTTFIDTYRKGKRDLKVLDDWMRIRILELSKQDNELTDHKIKYMLAAIDALPPRCKEIFLLSKYENLKYKEISERLNISIKTVEAQMARAFLLIRTEVLSKKMLNLVMFFLKK